ncbi:MAG: hypothetical protein DBY36_01935 [Clostridiales bacterium]|nr:MAG: hypothetical protein DBY36_01935 [Clostridiales bacterium]
MYKPCTTYRLRLVALGRRQIDVLREAQSRGYKMTAPALCAALSAVNATPREQEIRDIADQIITEWENEERKE